MERQEYVFEVPGSHTITGTRVIQRRGDGSVLATFLTDGQIDGEPIADDDLERLARRHAGYQ